MKAIAWTAECSSNCMDPDCPYTHPPKKVKILDIINKQGEVVGALEIEDSTATRVELENHYTQFVRLFMKHLGRNLKVITREQ